MTKTTTAKQPQPAPQKPLAGIFNAFGAQATRDFPQLKGKFFIADVQRGLFYADHENIDLEKMGLSSKEELIRYLGAIAATAREEMTSMTCRDPAHHAFTIPFNETVKLDVASGVSPDTEKEILFILDHEFAHCVIDEAYYYANSPLHVKNMAECLADAYALIRHYQRFGANSSFEHSIISPKQRLENMILSHDKVHFTSFVLEEIIQRRHQIDFAGLTPEQTVDLAWRFATKYAPAAPVIERLYKTFAPVRKAYKTSLDEGRKALAELALNPHCGYYAFKTAGMYLRAFLDDCIKNGDETVTLRGNYWDSVRHRLKQREFQFAQEGILFNTPRTKSAAVNQNTLAR